MGNAIMGKLPTLDDLNGSIKSATLPTLDELNGVKKKEVAPPVAPTAEQPIQQPTNEDLLAQANKTITPQEQGTDDGVPIGQIQKNQPEIKQPITKVKPAEFKSSSFEDKVIEVNNLQREVSKNFLKVADNVEYPAMKQLEELYSIRESQPDNVELNTKIEEIRKQPVSDSWRKAGAIQVSETESIPIPNLKKSAYKTYGEMFDATMEAKNKHDENYAKAVKMQTELAPEIAEKKVASEYISDGKDENGNEYMKLNPMKSFMEGFDQSVDHIGIGLMKLNPMFSKGELTERLKRKTVEQMLFPKQAEGNVAKLTEMLGGVAPLIASTGFSPQGAGALALNALTFGVSDLGGGLVEGFSEAKQKGLSDEEAVAFSDKIGLEKGATGTVLGATMPLQASLGKKLFLNKVEASAFKEFIATQGVMAPTFMGKAVLDNVFAKTQGSERDATQGAVDAGISAVIIAGMTHAIINIPNMPRQTKELFENAVAKNYGQLGDVIGKAAESGFLDFATSQKIAEKAKAFEAMPKDLIPMVEDAVLPKVMEIQKLTEDNKVEGVIDAVKQRSNEKIKVLNGEITQQFEVGDVIELIPTITVKPIAEEPKAIIDENLNNIEDGIENKDPEAIEQKQDLDEFGNIVEIAGGVGGGKDGKVSESGNAEADGKQDIEVSGLGEDQAKENGVQDAVNPEGGAKQGEVVVEQPPVEPKVEQNTPVSKVVGEVGNSVGGDKSVLGDVESETAKNKKRNERHSELLHKDKMTDAERKEYNQIGTDRFNERKKFPTAFERSKNQKQSDIYDEVHDAILSDGEDMPKGYSAVVVDSYYEPVLKNNHTIAKVFNDKGEGFYVDVNTYNQQEVGKQYGESKAIFSKNEVTQKTETPKVEPSKNHQVYYNGKVVDMGYVPNAKEQFKFAGQRISDNLGTDAKHTESEGYIKTPDGKYYEVSKSNKSAKLLTGDKLEIAKSKFEPKESPSPTVEKQGEVKATHIGSETKDAKEPQTTWTVDDSERGGYKFTNKVTSNSGMYNVGNIARELDVKQSDLKLNYLGDGKWGVFLKDGAEKGYVSEPILPRGDKNTTQTTFEKDWNDKYSSGERTIPYERAVELSGGDKTPIIDIARHRFDKLTPDEQQKVIDEYGDEIKAYKSENERLRNSRKSSKAIDKKLNIKGGKTTESDKIDFNNKQIESLKVRIEDALSRKNEVAEPSIKPSIKPSINSIESPSDTEVTNPEVSKQVEPESKPTSEAKPTVEGKNDLANHFRNKTKKNPNEPNKLGFGLPEDWNDKINNFIADRIEAGDKLVTAIAKAIKWADDNLSVDWDKVGFVNDAIANTPKKFKEGKTDAELIKDARGIHEIGAKKVLDDALRSELGLPPLELPKRLAQNEELQHGKKLVDNGVKNPQEIMDRMIAGKENPNALSPSPDDQLALKYYNHQLQAQKIQLLDAKVIAQEKLDANPNDEQAQQDFSSITAKQLINQDATAKFLDANAIMGNVLSKGFTARQGTFDEQGEIVNAIHRIKTAFGDDVPEPIKKELSELQSKYELLEAQNKKIQDDMGKLVAQKAIEKEQFAQRKANRSVKKADIASREKEVVGSIKNKVADILARIAEKSGGKLNVVEGEPFPKEMLGELASDITDLMKVQLDKGLLKIDEVTDAIHEHLKDIISGLSKDDIRDIISGRYSEKRPLSELQKQVADLRSQARAQAKIEDLEKGIVAETKKRGEQSPEVKALQKQVADLKKNAPNINVDASVSELKSKAKTIQAKIDKGEFLKIPTAKKLWENNPKWLANNKAKEKVMIRLRELERAALDSSKSKYMRGLDIVGQWGRRTLFFGSQAYQLKLGVAALSSLVHMPLEELAGAGFSKIFPNIAELSPIEAGLNLESLGRFYAEAGNPKTLIKNTWDIAKTGTTPLERRLDESPRTTLTMQGIKDHPTIFGKIAHIGAAEHIPVVDLFATDPHQMIKDPIKRGKFEMATIKHLAYYEKQGLNPNEHVLLETAENAAYRNAKMEIFMGSGLDKQGILKDKGVIKTINDYFNGLEKSGIVKNSMPALSDRVGGNVEYTAAMLYHSLVVPIQEVPMNIIKRVYMGNPFVLAKNLGSAYFMNKEIGDGILSLSHSEADLVLRQLKKGVIGSAYWTLGVFVAGGMAGGLYNRFLNKKERQKSGELQADELKLGDTEIPHNAQHSTQITSFQMGATWSIVYDHYLGKGKSWKIAASLATLAVGGATAEQIPLVKGVADIYESTQGNYGATAFADNFKRRIGLNKIESVIEYLGVKNKPSSSTGTQVNAKEVPEGAVVNAKAVPEGKPVN